MLTERRTAVVTIAVAWAASLVIYLPSLGTDFVSDDYLLLLASRDMSWGEFLRATWDPGADPGVLILSANYWRPLSFLLFRVTYEVAGENPLPYHLVNLTIHLAGIAVLYALALRLTKSALGAAVAALVFALHPAGVEAITWISALNSAALPLVLGSWLALAIAVEDSTARRGPLVASLVLLALALAFRETAAAIAGAMLVWYILVPARTRLRDPATWVIAGAFVILVLAHAIIFAGIFGDEAGRPLWDVGSQGIERGWFYVRQAVLPTTTGSAPVVAIQHFLGAAFVAIMAVAAIRREWAITALGIGLFIAIFPYAFYSLGFGPRYFYFPSAVFALVVGAIVPRAGSLIPVPDRRWTQVAVAGLAVWVIAGTAVARGRVERWIEHHPEPTQTWVEGLEATHSDMPDDAGIWIVDPPLAIALLDAYIIPAIISYVYHEEPQLYVISSEHLDYARSVQDPDDIFYIWEGSPAAGQD